MSIRIVIAERQQIVREGLRCLFCRESDLQIVGECVDARAALELTEQLSPQVLVLDVNLCEPPAQEVVGQIMSQRPATRLILLAERCNSVAVQESLRQGASGYLLKDCASSELLEAVRAPAGTVFLSPPVAAVVVNCCLRNPPAAGESPLAQLTAREREVLQMLADGLSAKQIALTLKLSAKTVETHRANIMEKLNLHSIAGLTKYAIREGLTGLES